MKRFAFNLQKLLALRIKEEEQAGAELKAALAVVHGIEDELEDLRQKRGEAEAALLAERRKPSMNVFRILVLEEGGARLFGESERTRARLKEARRKADAVREKYREAKRNRECLERIRERKYKRYMLRIKAEEQKRLDEVAVTRFMQRDRREKLGV
jgi:flagellar FliJ protein